MQLPLSVAFPDEIVDTLTGLRTQMDDILSRLARIERRQVLQGQAIDRQTTTLTTATEAFMADFTALHDEVEANGDAVDSAVTLLNTLSTQLADAADDPAEVQAIADQLAAQADTLAAAVVANTPADPEPPVEPPVEPVA